MQTSLTLSRLQNNQYIIFIILLNQFSTAQFSSHMYEICLSVFHCFTQNPKTGQIVEKSIILSNFVERKTMFYRSKKYQIIADSKISVLQLYIDISPISVSLVPHCSALQKWPKRARPFQYFLPGLKLQNPGSNQLKFRLNGPFSSSTKLRKCVSKCQKTEIFGPSILSRKMRSCRDNVLVGIGDNC